MLYEYFSMMKSNFILIAVCLIAVSLKSQMILNPRFFNGYIVTASNDTIRGQIKLPKSASRGDFSFTDILWKVRFIDRSGTETRYYPGQLSAFSLVLENGRDVTFVSRPNTVKAFGGFGSDNRHLFLELAINGQLKLLKGYFFTSTPNGKQSSVVNYLQKGKGSLFRYRYVLFRLDMSEYLAEDVDLVQKIRKREYLPGDINEIVMEYNNWYNQKK